MSSGRAFALVLATGAIGGAAALSGAVAFVRAIAAGHLWAEANVPAAPVALVLGAQVYPSGMPSAFLAARLDLAKRLYDAGKVRVILVSGDNGAPEYNEPEAMRRYLVAAGVPAPAVVADYAGFDTYDSCARACRVFGVSAVTVVTQTYHLPRAVATARLLGLQANGVGDDSVRPGRAWRKGTVRDQVACVKTIWDLASRRDPVLGRAETGVTDALTR